ncbi:MAG: hypothetical protein GC166_10140 [Alphaproteobacteria bacterium]|nr:hypothetical protein [Alphaproteobacteria bacterium]
MTDDERARIEAACTRLQQRYGTLADRQDPKFRDLFTADATITLPEYPPFTGIETIMQGQSQWRTAGILMRHVSTNFTIEVQDEEHAEGICYLMVFYGGEQPPDAREVVPTTPISLGEFHDRFVKTPDGWRFKSRTLHRIFRGTQPA